MKNKPVSKPSTVEEYLAQGGKIEIIPPVESDSQQEQTYSSTASNTRVPEILTLADAEKLFGEDRSRNKTNTDEEIVALLEKVVKRNPGFLEKHQIPDKFVKQLPEDLRSADKIRAKNKYKKINTLGLDDELMAIIAKQNPNVIESLGVNEQEESDSQGTGEGNNEPSDD